MIKSMTAYGRAEHETEGLLFVVEIRSVNNRYRDMILRLPKNLQVMEEELRGDVSSRIRRGRIEVTVQAQEWGDVCATNLKLNTPLVQAYVQAFRDLADQFHIDQNISLEALCQMKDVLLVEPRSIDVERLKPALRAALKGALDSHEEMRTREGAAMEQDIRGRLEMLETSLKEIEVHAPRVVDMYRTRLRDRVNEMLQDLKVDENRLAQEVALFAERSDITEEIVRFKSHIVQFYTYLSLDDAVGRRLDFLIQEMNREVNTISAKASDSTISLSVVEMKAELEKLREQVQNVE